MGQLVLVTRNGCHLCEHALSALGAPADRGGAWMVGDNLDADIRGAAALGMRTCWIAPPERAAPAGVAPTARISRFPDIAGVLA